MAAARALDLLLSPGSRLVSTVTVREGLRLDETLKLLAARTGLPVSDYQKALLNPQAIGLPAYAKGNAEGFLFPATYEVPPDATATAVLKLMTARFAEAAETTGIAKAVPTRPTRS
jgi:UPF0755 protein